ncbi:hypothetical protein HZS_2322 [Henneguya salminicola]|nr:hypothetical protein HZS_2322 [Henneguya salminicola]
MYLERTMQNKLKIKNLKNDFLGRRRKPKISHVMWNFYNNVVEWIPRTKNNIECWYRRVQMLIIAPSS